MEWIENNTGDESYEIITDIEDIEKIYKHFCAQDRIAIYNELVKEFEHIEDYEFCCQLRDKIKELNNGV